MGRIHRQSIEEFHDGVFARSPIGQRVAFNETSDRPTCLPPIADPQGMIYEKRAMSAHSNCANPVWVRRSRGKDPKWRDVQWEWTNVVLDRKLGRDGREPRLAQPRSNRKSHLWKEWFRHICRLLQRRNAREICGNNIFLRGARGHSSDGHVR